MLCLMGDWVEDHKSMFYRKHGGTTSTVFDGEARYIKCTITSNRVSDKREGRRNRVQGGVVGSHTIQIS